MKGTNYSGAYELVKGRKSDGTINPGEAGTNPPVTQPPVTMASSTTSNTNPNAGAANSSNSYNPINNQVWGEGGGGYEAHMEQAEQEAAKRQNDPTYGQAYTYDELVNLGASYGIDASKFGVNPSRGAYSSDPNYVYTDRSVYEGAAGADEFWMSDGALELVRVMQGIYNDPNSTAAQRDEARRITESVRAMFDYSGGADGSMYITNGEMGLANSRGQSGQGSVYNGSGQGGTSGASGSASDLNALLEAWQEAALNQSNGQIDYAVAKAVADLERALQDAQPQFKEQAETVAREERQALDNSALYAEMRGDKGGIGQEQYNSIQNTAAQNHLAVQQAQTKLATDTQRQIADLRAQGEFEKADAALEITQTYLAQLISLEQWAAEYNLSVEQFEASLQQWEAEYNMAMQQFQTGVNQWQAEFDAAQSQWQQQFDYNKQNDLAALGEALLSAGILLTEEQLTAMGISPEQASLILWQQQFQRTGK